MKYQASFRTKHDIFTRENNKLFSHVKRSPLLWLHDKSQLLRQTISLKYFFAISLVFNNIMNRTLHGCLEIQNFSSCVEKYFTRSRIFQHLKRNFVSLDSNVVSSRSIDVIYSF